ncbi:MAG: hypothetical protein AB1298_05820 [Bacteroidota bacterium]
MKSKAVVISFLFFIWFVSLPAQTQSNLDVIYRLIQQSVVKVDSILGGKKTIYISVTSPQLLEALKPKIYQSFTEHGYILKSSANESDITVNCILTSAGIEYKNSFSSGLFGGTVLERKAMFAGSYLIVKSNNMIQPFEYAAAKTDTIKLEEISALENQTLPFTQAKIPAQPLLTSLLEPIIVVGTLIVTVILLFTVRGK